MSDNHAVWWLQAKRKLGLYPSRRIISDSTVFPVEALKEKCLLWTSCLHSSRGFEQPERTGLEGWSASDLQPCQISATVTGLQSWAEQAAPGGASSSKTECALLGCVLSWALDVGCFCSFYLFFWLLGFCSFQFLLFSPPPPAPNKAKQGLGFSFPNQPPQTWLARSPQGTKSHRFLWQNPLIWQGLR